METDYISREAVETFLRSRNYCLDTEADIEYVVECLRKEIPAADVRPVKEGRWILHISDLFPADSTIECDQCHAEQPCWIDDNFCPNCGADMRPEGETP